MCQLWYDISKFQRLSTPLVVGVLCDTFRQNAIAEILVRERRVIDFVLDPLKKLQRYGLQL